VLAALAFLFEMGIKKIDLAGYSFGSWVNAHALREDTPVENMVMVSPPVGFMAFQPTNALGCLRFVVTGSEDDIAPAELVEKMIPQWNEKARFEVIDGADHFYGGYMKELESVLSSNL